MRVRKLDADGDMQFGHGQRDYWQNAPEGVAQLVSTRLQLQPGDWFLDLADGMPWRIKVAGRRTDATRDAGIRSRILATQGVKAINTYASQVNRQARSFGVQIMIDTIYGTDPVAVSSPPGTNIDVRNGR